MPDWNRYIENRELLRRMLAAGAPPADARIGMMVREELGARRRLLRQAEPYVRESPVPQATGWCAELARWERALDNWEIDLISAGDQAISLSERALEHAMLPDPLLTELQGSLLAP